MWLNCFTQLTECSVVKVVKVKVVGPYPGNIAMHSIPSLDLSVRLHTLGAGSKNFLCPGKCAGSPVQSHTEKSCWAGVNIYVPW